MWLIHFNKFDVILICGSKVITAAIMPLAGDLTGIVMPPLVIFSKHFIFMLFL